MGQAAYKAIVKIGGTPTSFIDEATSNIGGNLFQIDDVTKRTLNRSADVVVKVDGVVVPSAEYSIDYLFGIISFKTAQSGDATVSSSFIPTLSVVGANQYSVDITGDILDNTNFSDAQVNGGYRTKQYGILDVAMNISRFDDLAKTFKSKLENRQVILIEVKPGNGNETIKGWFVIESAGSQGEINSLEVEALSFQLDGDINSAFSWRSI